MHEVYSPPYPAGFIQLCQPFLEHLAVQGILQGHVPARLYADDPVNPGAVLISRPPRFYLAGFPSHDRLAGEIAELVRGCAGENEVYLCFFSPSAWENLLEDALKGLFPISRFHESYSLELEERLYFQGFLPDGITLARVDGALIEAGYAYVEDLKEEMCSERASVEEFLKESFGLVPVHDGKIIGWCLSEYNTAEACEIGIAVRPEYRQRGLATALTLAFLDLARQNQVKRVGWHCWKDNIASARTAVKAGFRLRSSQPVLFGFYDEVVQMGVHGNMAMDLEHYPVALSWYEMGLQRGDAPGWLWWNALLAAAWAGKETRAIQLVEAGLAKNKLELGKLQTSTDLAGLRQHPSWKW